MINDNYKTEEEEANFFARCLLMPKDIFIKIARENYNEKDKTYDGNKIAEYFNLSLVQIEKRGFELGLFK